MSNDGFKKATVAYKTDGAGHPLDINGELTSVSGLRQAIAVRQGFPNPNPTLYEIERYFTTELDGEPTFVIDTVSCPIGGVSPWVLDGGTWHMANFWYDDRIWTTI